MSDQKKVLVVDDHFGTLEFLRSTLDLLNQDYEMQAVPSAEEGLLEIRQTKFDLLIAEARLPGMSGFDLVRQTRRLRPDLPAIMMTEYSSEQGQQEAADLGVKHYFQKPLDSDMVLAAVHMSLYGDLVVYADDPNAPEPADLAITKTVEERLRTLRSETAASRIVLATATGRVLTQVGSGLGIDLPRLTAVIAHNLINSAHIAQELGGTSPNTIQYHAGNEMELYIASGGRDYFLVIFFDAQARRGRMGTIWVFAQRAIKDLLPKLPVLNTRIPRPFSATSLPVTDDDSPEEGMPWPGSTQEGERAITDQADTPPIGDQATAEANTQVSGIERGVMSELPAPTESEGFFILDGSATEAPSDIDAFWESAVSESPATAQAEGAFSFEQAQRRGLISGETEPKDAEAAAQSDQASDTVPADLAALFALEEETAANASELDDFWSEALAEQASGDPAGLGFSFEEAMRQGLISDAIESGDMTAKGAEEGEETRDGE